MQYSVGDKVQTRINKIQDNGCYCSFLPLWQNQYGFMPNYFMPSCFDKNGNITIKVGDDLTAVINKISDKGFILSDVPTYEKKLEKLQKKEENARQQVLINDFVSKYEVGTIFEVEVSKVKKSKVIINLGGINGYIKKEDTNWNEINRLEDLLYEGEIINAVFIKHENNQLFFSIKYLNEKPYEDCLYNLSLSELLKFIGVESNVFIGQAKRYHYGLFIENLYSAIDNQKGKLLIDPIYGYNLRAIVLNTNFNVEENKFYKISLALSPQTKRIERNQLFQFIAVNIEEAENPYKTDVNLAFQRNTTNPASNQRDAKLLDEIGKNMYSSKDRMFFELIQNADDAASIKGVLVNVKTDGDYLILKHNGYSFDKNDFVSITTAANGTKKANENKTGYKGIGFKSVFTDSIQVFINTGGYKFKFDKNEPIFQNFDKFYLDNNPMIINEETKKLFLELYWDYKKQFDGIHSIPWQLEPIWIDNFPTELGEDFTLSNVAIALKLGKNKIEGNNGYIQAIDEIISKPKFMLFLRNTKRIDFNEKSVSKTTKEGVITLKNSFDTNKIEYFKREDFEVLVNNTVFEENAIDIRITIDKQEEETGNIIEAKFVDLHNQELENIPKKIAINNSTFISFAIPIEEDGTLKPNTECNEISLFAFLPTLVKDFKFPFYINANFILDPPRQRILGDNPWNFYLMQEIARCLVRWCASLNKKQDKNALNILINKAFDEDSADTKQLSKHFNSAYKSALETEAFILNSNGELAKQDEIIIDKTGLSDIFGYDCFYTILGTNKKLPSPEIDSKILDSDIFELIEKVKINDVIPRLIDSEIINNWYISATQQEQGLFLDWLKKHEENSKDVIKSIPLIKFGDEYRSCNFIADNSHYIILKDIFASVKPILNELGIICSDEIINPENFLHSYLPKQTSNDIFVLINNQFKEFVKCDSIMWQYDNCDAYRGLEIDIANAFVGAHLLSKKNHHELIESQKCLKNAPEEYYEQQYDYFLTYEIPNICRQQLAESSLSQIEKIDLLGVVKKLKIDDSDKKSLIIFKNTENIYVPIGNMLPYREDAPDWIKPYMVNKDEYSEELDDLLINDENRFVWENMLNGFNVSINDIYSFYPWTDESYTRKLIDAFKADEKYNSLIDIVEKSGIDTKKFYLEKINRIDLNDERKYMEDSWEYRVLQLALVTLNSPSDLSSKIFYEGQCIRTFSTSDDVICEYTQDGITKRPRMSLAKLLPQYQNQSNSIDKIKNLFDKKNGLDKFFELKVKKLQDVYRELNDLLDIPDRNFSLWNEGNAYQFLFSTYYRRYRNGWFSSFIPKIDLIKEDDSFICDLMDFLFKNDVNIKDSPFTYHISSYIIDKFFANEFIIENEELLLPKIERWADTDDKKNYLKRNGAKGIENTVITLRKHFIDNEPCPEIDDLLSNALAINKMLHFLSVKDSLIRPFTGENQKEAFKALRNGRNGLSVETDVAKLEQNWTEYNDPEYDSWRQKTGKPEIRLYKGLIPRYFEYEKVRLADFEEGNYFETLNRHIYINANIDRQETLSQLVSDSKIHFYSDDFFELCFKGKQAVSKEEWEELKKSNKDLEEKNKRLEENNKRLEEENKRLGKELKNLGNKSRDKDVEMGASGGPDIDTVTKINAQLEARRKLMEIYPNWIYPEGFTKGDVYSTFQIVDDQGNKMSIVLKSYKKNDVKFHINPNEWDCLMDGAKLFIYRGDDDIFELDPKYLIENQPSIGLSFSTENFDLEERIRALSDALHYFKQITFDFSSFNVSEKAESIKEMYNKNHKKQNDFGSQDY